MRLEKVSNDETLLYDLGHGINWLEDTVFWGLQKENATVSVGSDLK
jgi:hypothetical protein